jgi:hypothetical protein
MDTNIIPSATNAHILHQDLTASNLHTNEPIVNINKMNTMKSTQNLATLLQG